MPFNFNQQEPGMFPAIDAMKQSIHPITKYVLAACGAVGGFTYGQTQDWLPVAFCTAIGLVIGILLIELFAHFTTFVTAACIVLAAGAAMYWLLSNDAALKNNHSPVQHAAPSRHASPGWLISEVR